MHPEPTVTGRKLGLKSTVWSRGRTFNQDRMKKQELKNMMRGLGTSGTSLSAPTSKSQGCQKDKRKSKKLKTYLKNIMKENFPDLVKEIDFQEVQEA